LELSGAIEVFREGAENGTRGACAPHLDFGFRDELSKGRSRRHANSLNRRLQFSPTRRLILSREFVPGPRTRPRGGASKCQTENGRASDPRDEDNRDYHGKTVADNVPCPITVQAVLEKCCAAMKSPICYPPTPRFDEGVPETVRACLKM